MIVGRTLHTTDEQLDGREYRRTISNHRNYQTAAGIWLPSDPKIEGGEERIGACEFLYSSSKAPLQAFFGASGVLGVRLSDRPDCCMNLKAARTNTAAKMITKGQSVTWIDLWDGCDLTFTAARNKVDKLITLKERQHPKLFGFTVKLAQGHKAEVREGCLVVRDGQGKEWLRTLPVWGVDAAGKAIRVSLLAEDGNITVQPNEEDLVGATYPVKIDPTTAITGANITSSWVITGAGLEDNNYGASTGIPAGNVGGVVVYRCFLRLSASAIPAGAISAFELNLCRYSSAASAQAGVLQIFRISNANTWVKGTVFGAPEFGSDCWNYAKYNTQAWAGSIGCGTSGTDYDADASPPGCSYIAYTAGDPYWLDSITLPTSWAGNWKTGVRVSNGMMLKIANEATNLNLLGCYGPSEGSAANFSIDYTVLPIFQAAYNRRRK